MSLCFNDIDKACMNYFNNNNYMPNRLIINIKDYQELILASRYQYELPLRYRSIKIIRTEDIECGKVEVY